MLNRVHCLRALLPLLALVTVAPLQAADRTGEQIYRQECARCHGRQGEGTKKFPQPLVGDKSPGQLTQVIQKTMPENDPGSLSMEDAKKVAEYVYNQFYSPDAQYRMKPPRVELTRLTVRQYRNAVADLIGSFRPTVKLDERRGLRGEYFNARGFRNRQIERLDPTVKFDFGTSGPDAKFDPHQFSIRWEGSILAPETGEYEFVVRTDHAARLWVNHPTMPLIDAWVKSGDDTEYRASITLLAGRAYPVRLEFSKAKQGVDDSNKQKAPPPKPASIALLWKLPGRTVEVIPSRHLSPIRAPEAFVVSTPFPPDDRSLGWERGTAVSKAWDSATTDAAIETAGYVAARLEELAGVRPANLDPGPPSGNPAQIDLDAKKDQNRPIPDRERKLREFARKFVDRAFRRPLTPDQAKVFVDRHFDTARTPDEAIKRVVLFALKSPRFLYREVGGGPDQFDVAARLSFALWDSIPDTELLAAAAAGQLTTREQVVKQAERMLTDSRARAKLHGFLLTWLKLDHAPDMAKDPKRFPGFDAALTSDLRTSLDLFLDEAVWKAKPDFRQLLLSDELYLNDRLAKFYGAALPPGAGFQKVKLNPQARAGVLTHPYVMAAFAYTAESSPIHRGVFLARGVLGLALRPPQDAFTPLPAELHPTLTTRERVTLQTKPSACITCHGVINPLGFTLEHFDAVGRYREQENGKPVDASGSYLTRTGDEVKFSGVRDLATFLAASPEVHTAFAEQLFHHLVQQPVRAYGPRRMEELRESFIANGFDIRKLVIEIVSAAALRGREVKPPPPAAAGQ